MLVLEQNAHTMLIIIHNNHIPFLRMFYNICSTVRKKIRQVVKVNQVQGIVTKQGQTQCYNKHAV